MSQPDGNICSTTDQVWHPGPHRGKDEHVTDEMFYRGLLAAMVASGLRCVDTRHDRHQVALRRAVQRLEALQQAGVPGTESMPAAIIPGPVTGAYEDFDDALLRLQDLGYDSAQNPFYAGVALTLSDRRVERILARFSSDERAVLHELADLFKNEESTVA